MEREIVAIRRARRRDNDPVAAVFCITGVGQDRVNSCLAAIQEAGQNPKGILSMGYAAALKENMAPGDLVVTKSLYATGKEASYETDPTLLALALEVVRELQPGRHHLADSVTVYGVATSRAEKRLLAASTPASIANMEDYWVAEWAHPRGIPYLSVRSVLDTLSEDVPEFISGLAGKVLPAQAIGVAIQGLARPEKLRSVARLFREDRLARRSLKEFGTAFLERTSGKISYAAT
jgi:nucleoside phosphorylase